MCCFGRQQTPLCCKAELELYFRRSRSPSTSNPSTQQADRLRMHISSQNLLEKGQLSTDALRKELGFCSAFCCFLFLSIQFQGMHSVRVCTQGLPQRKPQKSNADTVLKEERGGKAIQQGLSNGHGWLCHHKDGVLIALTTFRSEEVSSCPYATAQH